MSARSAGALLLGVALLALCVRCLGVADVFLDGDRVSLAMWDSSYHARRAFFTFANFPAVLLRDSYIAHPHGAVVPMPPLYDWLLGAVAWLLADSERGFERVAALWSPALSSLTVLPLYGLGQALGGRGVGLVAAALFALLPASVEFSRLGDVDHHAAVSLLGTTYLWLVVRALRRGPRQATAASVGLVIARSVIALSWSGSLLLFVLGEGALLFGGVVSGGPRRPFEQAIGTLVTAALLAVAVAWLGTPAAGPLTGITLSWLHAVFFVGVAGVTGTLAAIERMRPAPGSLRRLSRAAAVLLFGVLAILLALPGSDALLPALTFVAGADAWAPANREQQSLLAAGLGAGRWLFGSFVWLLPLAILAPLARLRDPEVRPTALAVAAWSLSLGALAVSQMRYVNEFAPAFCLGVALLLVLAGARLASRLRPLAAGAIVAAVTLALLWPAISAAHLPRLVDAAAWLRGASGDRALATGPNLLIQFARTIRAVTPPTAGWLDADAVPEYGVLCLPSHGHLMAWVARRPTAADGFGPYLDAASYEAVEAFYRADTEAEAIRLAESLDARYVLTRDQSHLGAQRFVHLLHRLDGSVAAGWQRAEHFRLIAESAAGPALPTAFPAGTPEGVIPYKLFERVAGAVLALGTEAGATVFASVPLVTPEGRRFRFRAAGRAGADGVARLRVPYATDGRTPTRAEGPYELSVDGVELRVDVPERAVRGGVELRVDAR
jgi:asparagine N-glycosylation enzyme membrane subunit Stt3